MALENPQEFAMPESLRRGSKTRFARIGMYETMRGKRLDQTGLSIATGTENYALDVVG